MRSIFAGAALRVVLTVTDVTAPLSDIRHFSRPHISRRNISLRVASWIESRWAPLVPDQVRPHRSAGNVNHRRLTRGLLFRRPMFRRGKGRLNLMTFTNAVARLAGSCHAGLHAAASTPEISTVVGAMIRSRKRNHKSRSPGPSIYARTPRTWWKRQMQGKWWWRATRCRDGGFSNRYLGQ